MAVILRDFQTINNMGPQDEKTVCAKLLFLRAIS